MLSGVTFKPSRDKREKWRQQMLDAQLSRHLTQGLASKLFGALQWATQHTFKRLGRAMVRPIARHAVALLSAV